MFSYEEFRQSYTVVGGWAVAFLAASFLFFSYYQWWNNEYSFYRDFSKKNKKTKIELGLRVVQTLLGLARRVLATALGGAIGGALAWRSGLEPVILISWGVGGAIAWRVGDHEAFNANDDRDQVGKFSLKKVSLSALLGMILGLGGAFFTAMSVFVLAGELPAFRILIFLHVLGSAAGIMVRPIGSLIDWNDENLEDTGFGLVLLGTVIGAVPWAFAIVLVAVFSA